MKELVYTSARSGLKLGSNGFCTVAMSDGLAVASVEFLERLSNVYRPVYMPYDSRATENPVAVSLVRVRLSGQSLTILSRNAASGVDHTGRTNNLAHHLVFESATECAASNPASVAASRQSFFEQWDQPPGRLPARQASVASGPSGTCRLWSELTGDSGWAATVASAWTARDSQPLYVIYPARTDILGLFAEAISLLPSERRWEATFTTYFTSLPPEATCTVRAVLAGTPQEIEARRSDHVDLMDLVGPAPDGILADRARGRQSNSKPEFVPVAARGRPVHSNEPDVPKASPVLKGASDNAIAIDEVPPEVNRFALHRSASSQATQKSGSGMWARILAVVFATVALLSLGVGAFVAKSQSDARAVAEQQRDDAQTKAENAERLQLDAESRAADAVQKLLKPIERIDPNSGTTTVPPKQNTDPEQPGGSVGGPKGKEPPDASAKTIKDLETEVSRLKEERKKEELKLEKTTKKTFDDWYPRLEELLLADRLVAYNWIDSAVERKKRSKLRTGNFVTEKQEIKPDKKEQEIKPDKKKKEPPTVLRLRVDPLLDPSKPYSLIGRYESQMKQGVPNFVPISGTTVEQMSVKLKYQEDSSLKEPLETGYYYVEIGQLPNADPDKKWIYVMSESSQDSKFLLWHKK